MRDWTIAIVDDEKHYLYGYQECPEEFDWIPPHPKILKEEEWDAEDYLEIFSNICEDNNSHSLANHIKYDIIDALKFAGIKCGVDEPGMVFVKEFINNYIQNAGWR